MMNKRLDSRAIKAEGAQAARALHLTPTIDAGSEARRNLVSPHSARLARGGCCP
jgi:hypothetical protein